MPLMSVGQHDLLAGVEGAGIVDEGEAELHVLHLLGRVLAVPGVDRGRAALGVGEQEGQRRGGDDREAARLVARIDVGRSRRCRRAPCRSGRRPCRAARRGTASPLIVPPDAFLMSSAQACSAGFSGAAAGTQLDSFSVDRLVLGLGGRWRAARPQSARARCGMGMGGLLRMSPRMELWSRGWALAVSASCGRDDRDYPLSECRAVIDAPRAGVGPVAPARRCAAARRACASALCGVERQGGVAGAIVRRAGPAASARRAPVVAVRLARGDRPSGVSGAPRARGGPARAAGSPCRARWWPPYPLIRRPHDGELVAEPPDRVASSGADQREPGDPSSACSVASGCRDAARFRARQRPQGTRPCRTPNGSTFSGSAQGVLPASALAVPAQTRRARRQQRREFGHAGLEVVVHA